MTEMSIRIVLNGTPQDVTAGMSVLDFLQSRSIDPSHVVVEVNRSIINRDEFANCRFKDNDTVEILRFVGGG